MVNQDPGRRLKREPHIAALSFGAISQLVSVQNAYPKCLQAKNNTIALKVKLNGTISWYEVERGQNEIPVGLGLG